MNGQKETMETEETAVVIVGGSLVGLSAAVFLSWRGVPNIVVERQVGSAPHPRAIGYTARTMELFRAVGLADRIPQAPPGFRLRRTRVESLAGKWMDESSWTPGKKEEKPPAKEEGGPTSQKDENPNMKYSPYLGAAIAQDLLEPMIRAKAQELGADVQQGAEMLSFEQDNNGITILVRKRNSGNEYQIRAQYMIAADGFRSPIREALRITRKGRGHIRTVRSVLFRAPLDEYLQSGFSQFEIKQPHLEAFLTTYQDGRWVLIFSDDVEHDESTLKEKIYQAIGRSDIEVQILTTGRWELTGLIADTYSSNRVFLAGDAAHTLPPTRGGFGANTGIEDVHNLAWKLQAVLAEKSTPELLDTYSAERQPIGWLRHQQTFARPDYAAVSDGIAEGEKILDDAALEVGQLYRSSSVIGASEDLPPAMKPDEWSGQPGTRAPHLWCTHDDKRISTLDLFQRGWVLLTEDAQWGEAASAAQEQSGIEVQTILVGTEVKFPKEDVFREAFGVGKTGVSLIRPDGYVAWRCRDLPEHPSKALTEALVQVACVPVGQGKHNSDV